MICEECGVRPATIRLMSVVNGEKVARNLCTHCLSDVKKQLPNLDLSGLDSMLANLIAATKKMGLSQEPEVDLTCPRCGTTYEAFQKSGLLGCADCYGAFREPLETLLKRIHGQTQHTGRVPGMATEDISQKIGIYTLKQQLNKAITAEEYEQAAELRDRIRALQQEMDQQELSEQEAHAHDGV
ncbi:UvrB/UvrC motif-containing protein [Eubacteriales bacterium OttesenSCG-928-N13]|nr:UvrB/UvrC motif-containing protein [Eubacteriales bacterium OttesenSCG-928-N13]